MTYREAYRKGDRRVDDDYYGDSHNAAAYRGTGVRLRRRRAFALAFAAVCAAAVCVGAMPEQINAYVNDFAGVIGASDRQYIAGAAAAIDNRYGGTQIFVVTVSSLGGMSIEEYAHKLFNTWGIGNRERNNGVLFLVVPGGERGSRLRIEVGYGLEGTLTDGTSGWILDQVMPYYTAGDYSAGIVVGFDLIAKCITGELVVPSGRSENNEFVAAMIMSIMMIFMLMIICDNAISKSGKGSPAKRVRSMGIEEGGYTTVDTSILEGFLSKRFRFIWYRGLPASLAACVVVLITLKIFHNNIMELFGLDSAPFGLNPGLVGILICPIASLFICRSIKNRLVCPECFGRLNSAHVVEKKPTTKEEGIMRWYFACTACGNKYVDERAIAKVTRFVSGSGGGGFSGGGGGSSGGGGASR